MGFFWGGTIFAKPFFFVVDVVGCIHFRAAQGSAAFVGIFFFTSFSCQALRWDLAALLVLLD